MDVEGLKTPLTRFKATQAIDSASPFLKMPASPLLETLGYGTGVQVYLVERSPRQGRYRSPWAVKKVSKTAKERQLYSKRLKDEANILKSLDHTNIIGFRALAKSSDGSLCMALEDGEKSLMTLIENRIDDNLGPFPPSNIMKMSADVTAALAYLHERQWLHGDLKSANVLIKGEFEVAKLCDFGVAIKLDENMKSPSSNYIGTESWSSKEALADDDIVSDKSDIYSFGLTIYEMLTLSIPHFNFPSEDEFESEDAFITACETIERNGSNNLGTRPLLPDYAFTNEYQSTIELFYVCCDENPNKRPSANQIKQMLEAKVQRTLVFD